MSPASFSLNLHGRLFSLSEPVVMGIINLTPDSFYAASRSNGEAQLTERVLQIVSEGGKLIDVGAYSSRPGASDVSVDEEMRRLRQGLKIIRAACPDIPVSVDTFRADVAKMCVEELGVEIVNDISAGELDKEMFPTIARLKVPYIMMHMKGNPRTMQDHPYYDDLMGEIFLYFSHKINRLREIGVSDIILDPGFGFAKTLEHNYQLLSHLEDFHEFQLPLLVGISRKSMIFRLLGGTPDSSLNGTTVLNVISLLKGAHILRVHDVKACVEAVTIVEKMKEEGRRL